MEQGYRSLSLRHDFIDRKKGFRDGQLFLYVLLLKDDANDEDVPTMTMELSTALEEIAEKVHRKSIEETLESEVKYRMDLSAFMHEFSTELQH